MTYVLKFHIQLALAYFLFCNEFCCVAEDNDEGDGCSGPNRVSDGGFHRK